VPLNRVHGAHHRGIKTVSSCRKRRAHDRRIAY
jgi:hypothetical protein